MTNTQLSVRLASLFLVAGLLAACASAPQPEAQFEPDAQDIDPLTTDFDVRFHTVPEAFVSALTPADNVDSPAAWRAPDGRTWVLATGKGTDQILVYDGDNGALLRRIGGPGSGAGQLDRPNGIFVHEDLALVVERDNHRVQAFRLPELVPLGSFGSEQLRQPYGLWLHGLTDGALEVIVSDAWMDPADEDRLPPLSQLDQRFRRFQVTVGPDGLAVSDQGSFGATDAAGAIRVPESLWGDVANDRLLIAEEDVATGTRLRDYGLSDRRYRRDIGADRFHAQAEGIALWQCADGSGYWIATDQYKDRSVFHLFDRQSLAHIGAFAGSTTANTDGVWLHQSGSERFPNGVFYAVHDDQALSAFD
ncbi:MAG: phytase, partial [Xanthomonadales bacterium]|nr:phytase [Xanthomonadales bacterium]